MYKLIRNYYYDSSLFICCTFIYLFIINIYPGFPLQYLMYCYQWGSCDRGPKQFMITLVWLFTTLLKTKYYNFVLVITVGIKNAVTMNHYVFTAGYKNVVTINRLVVTDGCKSVVTINRLVVTAGCKSVVTINRLVITAGCKSVVTINHLRVITL